MVICDNIYPERRYSLIRSGRNRIFTHQEVRRILALFNGEVLLLELADLKVGDSKFGDTSRNFEVRRELDVEPVHPNVLRRRLRRFEFTYQSTRESRYGRITYEALQDNLDADDREVIDALHIGAPKVTVTLRYGDSDRYAEVLRLPNAIDPTLPLEVPNTTPSKYERDLLI